MKTGSECIQANDKKTAHQPRQRVGHKPPSIQQAISKIYLGSIPHPGTITIVRVMERKSLHYRELTIAGLDCCLKTFMRFVDAFSSWSK